MDLKEHTGVHAKLPGHKLTAVLLENSTYSMAIYREGSVDWVFFNEAVVLTADTADALYRDFTPLAQPYVRGTRVFLEKIVDAVTAGCKSDRQKALALLDWVRDIPVTYQNVDGDPFHGGTEEEVIRKGSSMCNEQARVLGILAQVAGMPSRYVGHMTPIDFDDPKSGTGHGVNELYIENHWAYFDIRGKFFLKPDGAFASTWELIRNPALIDAQSPETLSTVPRK